MDSAAFEKFHDSYQAYRASLDEMPDAWKAANDAMGDAGKERLAMAAAQAKVISDELRDAIAAQNEFGRSTNTANKGLQSMSKTVGGISKSIFGMATSVLKMGAIGLGLGTLVGGFGFDALAGAALNRQRSANSLGIDPGQLASFQVNAQQFLGTGALQSAVDAQADITKAPNLGLLGIDFNRARKMDPGDLSFEILKKARAAYLEDQRNGLTPSQDPRLSIGAAGLGQDLNTVRNAAMAPESDINAAQRATRADAGGLGFDRATANSWITLKKTLDEAGMTIETSLIRALAPLAPEIADASKAVAGFIGTFLNSKEFGKIIDDVRDGMQDLGQFVTTTDWKGIGADIKQLSDELVAALRFLHLIPQAGDGDKGAPGPLLGGKQGFESTQGAKAVQGAWNWLKGAAGNVGNAVGGAAHAVQIQGMKDLWTGVGGDPKVAAKMAAIADAESSFNWTASHKNDDGTTDYGLWQINSIHAKELAQAGLKNWKTDPWENAQAALLVSGGKGGNNLKPWVTWNEYAAGKDTPAAHKIAADLQAKYGHGSSKPTPAHEAAAQTHSLSKVLDKHLTKTRAANRNAGKTANIVVQNSTSDRVFVSLNATALV